MFQALHPLIAERSIHVMLSALKDGRITVYVEPCKTKDSEDDAFVTPFRATATPAELDAQLPAILGQWIASRTVATTSLAESLAEAEATQKNAADEAKKKAAEKGKKPTTTITPSKPVVKVEPKPFTPSLLDDPATEAHAIAPVVAAPPSVQAAAVEPVVVQDTPVADVPTVVSAPADVSALASVAPTVVELAPAPVAPTISTEMGTPDFF